LGRALGLNEDLVEALALMHDLGHPPFGHAGEDVLDECLRTDGGFSHNAQALRIVELLEQRYPEFPGLNLSVEVLAGQQTRAEKNRRTERPLMEAQVVDAADSVAYDTHDVDDALQLGLLTLDDLNETPLWRETTDRVRRRYSDVDDGELRRATLHELIDRQASDLIESTRRRIEAAGVDTATAVRQADVLVRPSDDLAEQKLQLERFLYQRVYRHPQVVAGRNIAQDQLREMFVGFCNRPELMPSSFVERGVTFGVPRSVGDYIAGMTDHFAQREFQRLFAGDAAV
jgi:dGTPase